MIIIADADLGLAAGDLDRLEAISRAFVHHSGASIILIGADLGPRADWRPSVQAQRDLALVGARRGAPGDEAGADEAADTVVIEADGAQA